MFASLLNSAAAEGVRRLGRRSQSNFSYAFVFLGREQREALEAVYTFCRLVDDAADDANSPEEARAQLLAWREKVAAVYAPEAATDDPVVAELRRAAALFPIRREDLDAVIEGCEWDATRLRYESWDDLRAYCLRVASAVGLLCIAIFGYRDERAREYAIDLGIALS
jgi:phytoene synthase